MCPPPPGKIGSTSNPIILKEKMLEDSYLFFAIDTLRGKVVQRKLSNLPLMKPKAFEKHPQLKPVVQSQLKNDPPIGFRWLE